MFIKHLSAIELLQFENTTGRSYMLRLMPNAMTVDLEDWYHPEYIAERVDKSSIFPMIEESAERTLRLLQELGIRSTFFRQRSDCRDLSSSHS
jgi:hypothetical protein